MVDTLAHVTHYYTSGHGVHITVTGISVSGELTFSRRAKMTRSTLGMQCGKAHLKRGQHIGRTLSNIVGYNIFATFEPYVGLCWVMLGNVGWCRVILGDVG